jgi:hypothetical protein
VGLATANFGSLVRYKIPLMPFYVASLFIIRHYDKQLSIKRTEEHGNSKNIAVMEYNERIN